MSEAVPKLNFPLIPPKKTSNDPPSLSVDKEDTVPTWYIVQSPREIKGTAGPFSVEELRNLYQIGDLTDNTLVWKDGLEKWELLKDLTTLRHRMVYIPIVPPRLGSTFEDALINPIMNPPPSHVASNFERIHECRVDNVCSRCGSFASTHIYDSENKLPAFGFIRSEVGSCREASEVIPGFLFIGNSSSSKSSIYNRYSITLLINTTSNYKNPPARPPYFRCKNVPMPELLLNAGYSGSISIDEGGANDLPTIAIERNSESSSIAVDEIPLTDADIENILGSGYSHSRTRNHPELCSPLEPVFKALCECYNMIEYERIVDPSIIQKSDKFDVVHTQTGEIRQTLVKPTLPYYAPSDKYGRKSMNLLEKVDKPKGRPKSPSMINLNGGGSRGVGNALNSPSSSVPGSPAGKLRPVDSAPATPVASRTGAKQEDKSSRKYKGSAGTTFQKPRVLVWSHLGLDRAATVVVAYLIRRWNISIVQAIEFVKRNRPGITISPFHMRVLEVWERRFLCGNYVCMDCLVNSGGVTDAEYSASRQGTKKKDDMKAALLNDAGNGKDVTVVVNDGLDKITAGLSLNRKIGTGSTTELTVSHASPEIDGEEKLAQVKYGFIEDSYRAFKAACADDSPLGTKLGDVRDFLHGVRTSHYASTLTQAERTFGGDPAASIHKHHFLEASKYPTISNLCDLNLAGRLLNDGDIERLLEILLNMRIVQHIRTLELQNNHIGNKGLKSIMGALMIPKACFNEELELMSLDLSSNRFTHEGAEYVAAFLKTNTSLISLNLSNNQLSDAGGALIMNVFGMQDMEYISGNKAQVAFAEEESLEHAVEKAILRRKTSLDTRKSFRSRQASVDFNNTTNGQDSPSVRTKVASSGEESSTCKDILSGIEFTMAEDFSEINEVVVDGRKDSQSCPIPTRSLKFKVFLQTSQPPLTRLNSQASVLSNISDCALHGTAWDLANRDNESKASGAVYIPKIDSDQTLDSHDSYNQSITDINLSNNDLGSETAEAIIEMLKSNQTLVKLSLDVTPGFTTNNWKYMYDSMRLYNTSLKCISCSDSTVSVKSFAHLTKLNASKRCTISSFNYSRCNLLPGHMKLLVTSPCCTLLDNKNLLKLDISGNSKIMNEGILYLAASLRGGAHSNLQGENKNIRKSKMLLLDDDLKLNGNSKRKRNKKVIEEDAQDEEDVNILSGGGSGILIENGQGISYQGDHGSLSAAALQEQYNQSKSGSVIEYYDRNNVISSVQFSIVDHQSTGSLLYLDISCCGIIFYGSSTTKSSVMGTSRASLRSSEMGKGHTGNFPVGSGVAAVQSRNSFVTNEENNATFCLGILLDSLKHYCTSLQYLDLSNNNLNNCFGGNHTSASRKVSRMKKSRGKSSQSARNVSFAQEVGDVCDESSIISELNSTAGSVTMVNSVHFEDADAVNTSNEPIDNKKKELLFGEEGFVDSYVDVDEYGIGNEWENVDENSFVPEVMNDHCLEALSSLKLHVLKLNECKLSALSVNKLVFALCDQEAATTVSDELVMPHLQATSFNTSKKHTSIIHGNAPLYHTLKALYINKNNISDSICEPLTMLFQSNFILQELDLRYNQIGGLCMSKAMSVLKITSQSSDSMKYLNMNVELAGNPCDYSNHRETVNINKPSYSSQLTDHKAVSAAYEDVSSGFNVAKGDVITIPLPHLARSKQTLKYAYHMNVNTTTPVTTTSSTSDKGGIEVIENHVLSTMDHVPINAQKHFAIRKHYADLYQRQNPDVVM